MGGCASSQAPVKNGPDHQKHYGDKQQQPASAAVKLDALNGSQPQQHALNGSASSQAAVSRHAASNYSSSWPLPISEAPSKVGLHGRGQLPYAAPYIPEPSLPPPEHPHVSAASPDWQPARRSAVLVGVNYARALDKNARLKGSVNDIQCLKHLLTSRFGFQPDHIIVLHDEHPYPDFWPTKANIMGAVRWLVGDSRPQDSLVFAFSGHGCLDVSREQERDGILSSDYEQVGPICDDDLAKQLVGPLREGARLHCFVDACKGVFALGLPSCTFTRADGWSSWEEDQHGPDGAYLHPSTGGEAIMLSSSLADEDDADADWSEFASHASTGAVAFALIQAVEQGQAGTYNTLLRAMRYSLKNGPQHFAKVPELSASQDFDLNRPFLL